MITWLRSLLRLGPKASRPFAPPVNSLTKGGASTPAGASPRPHMRTKELTSQPDSQAFVSCIGVPYLESCALLADEVFVRFERLAALVQGT